MADEKRHMQKVGRLEAEGEWMIDDHATQAGVCCACGYAEPEESICPKMDDGVHCVHWWDGDEEVNNSEE